MVQPAAAFSYRTFYRTSGVSLWCIIAVGEQPSMLVALLATRGYDWLRSAVLSYWLT